MTSIDTYNNGFYIGSFLGQGTISAVTLAPVCEPAGGEVLTTQPLVYSPNSVILKDGLYQWPIDFFDSGYRGFVDLADPDPVDDEYPFVFPATLTVVGIDVSNGDLYSNTTLVELVIAGED